MLFCLFCGYNTHSLYFTWKGITYINVCLGSATIYKLYLYVYYILHNSYVQLLYVKL